MIVEKSEELPINAAEDVVKVRQAVRTHAVAVGFSLVDQTKIVTAASEIARNALDYAGGGRANIHRVRAGSRVGLRLIFSDEGPGIEDVEKALSDGFSSSGGLGLGLSGAKRLSNEFYIESTPGVGTSITLIRWKR